MRRRLRQPGGGAACGRRCLPPPARHLPRPGVGRDVNRGAGGSGYCPRCRPCRRPPRGGGDVQGAGAQRPVPAHAPRYVAVATHRRGIPAAAKGGAQEQVGCSVFGTVIIYCVTLDSLEMVNVHGTKRGRLLN